MISPRENFLKPEIDLPRKRLKSADACQQTNLNSYPDIINNDGLPQIHCSDGHKNLVSPFEGFTAAKNQNEHLSSSQKLNKKLFKSSLSSLPFLKSTDDSINSTSFDYHSRPLKPDEFISSTSSLLTPKQQKPNYQSKTSVSTMTNQSAFRPEWLNENYVTPITRTKSFSDFSRSRMDISVDVSSHAQTPKLYFDSKFSRMYTKLVDRKLVLVSHPYDLPFSDKTMEKTAASLKSPYELHTDITTPRNLSFPGSGNKWSNVESRFDKLCGESSASSDWSKSGPMRAPPRSQESISSVFSENDTSGAEIGRHNYNTAAISGVGSLQRSKSSYDMQSRFPVSKWD